MKIINSKKKGNVVKLEIEETQESINNNMDAVFTRVVKSAKLPGFRKGKIPRKIFEKNFGKEVLLKDAIMDTVNEAYSKAISELDLKVIDYPKNMDIQEYKEEQPLKFSCDVEVMPDVKMGKYKKIKVKRELQEIKDENVKIEVDALRERYAEYQLVDRESQKEDFLLCNMTAVVDEKKYGPWTKKNTNIRVGTSMFGEEFDQKVFGLKKGENTEFSMTYPSDFQVQDVAGKSVSFSLEVIEIREKTLPEFNAEFVAKISHFKTPEALEEKIKESLSQEARQKSDEKLKSDIMTKIIEDMKVDIPQVLIDREISHSYSHFESQVKQAGSSIDHYLKATGKTKEDIKAEVGKDADKRIKAELALENIYQIEKLTVEDNEIEEEIRKMRLPEGASVEDFKSKRPQDLDHLKNILKRKKTYDFLIDHAKISG